jgi:hypothetical protein
MPHVSLNWQTLPGHPRPPNRAMSQAKPSTRPHPTAIFFFAATYSVVYALALVGSLPFAQATAIYIAVFYTHFTWNRSATVGEHLKRIAMAITFGVVGAYAIASLFQYGFLVRLP